MNLFSKKIVALDFHDYSSQLVEISSEKGKYYLNSYSRIHISPGVLKDGEIIKKDLLKKSLQRLFAEANPSPVLSKNIAVIFPSTQVFNHIFSYPSNLSKKDIEKSITFEAETVIPFSLHDVYFDYKFISEPDPKDKKSETRVLFTAIPKKIADSYTELLQEMGLNPTIFGTDIEALHFGIFMQTAANNHVLSIDIGTLSTNFLLSNSKNINYFMSLRYGGKKFIEDLSVKLSLPEAEILVQKEKNDLPIEAGDYIKEFFQKIFETGKELSEGKKEQFGEVKDIILTGEFLNLPGFYEIAKNIFINQRLHIGDPRNFLNIKSDHFQSQAAMQTAPFSTYFLNCVGLAIRGLIHDPLNGINLLPDRLRKLNKDNKISKIMNFSAVLMCILSLLFAGMIFYKQQQLSYQRGNLEAQKTSVDRLIYGTRYQQIRDEIIRFNKEVADLQNIDKGLFSTGATLQDILSLMPEGVKVESFKFSDSDLSVNLSGIASSREALLEAQKNLKKSLFIQEVITPLSNFDEKTNISFSFNIILLFKELPKYGETTE